MSKLESLLNNVFSTEMWQEWYGVPCPLVSVYKDLTAEFSLFLWELLIINIFFFNENLSLSYREFTISAWEKADSCKSNLKGLFSSSWILWFLSII